jgi:hypothetical protein
MVDSFNRRSDDPLIEKGILFRHQGPLGWLLFSNVLERIEMEQKQEISQEVNKTRDRLRLVLRVATGALLGYGFYMLVGCPSGACALTSNPWIPTALGAIIGYVTAA